MATQKELTELALDITREYLYQGIDFSWVSENENAESLMPDERRKVHDAINETLYVLAQDF